MPVRKNKKSIKDIPKSFLKLLKAANKVLYFFLYIFKLMKMNFLFFQYKEVLSANKEAHVYIEGLADGIDFHTTIHRSTFEDLC